MFPISVAVSFVAALINMKCSEDEALPHCFELPLARLNKARKLSAKILQLIFEKIFAFLFRNDESNSSKDSSDEEKLPGTCLQYFYR